MLDFPRLRDTVDGMEIYDDIRQVLVHGPATIDGVASVLEVYTRAQVKRHLTRMLETGKVQRGRPVLQGTRRGAPPYWYSLVNKGASNG